MQVSKEVDVKEVLNNLGIVCKGCKFTLEEHQYLQAGLSEISKKLQELEDLKAPKKAEEKE